MKAAVYEGVKSIKIQERETPKAAPGEVIVKVKYCGICGTDVHSYLNGDRKPGQVLGHEIVGTISEIGAGVQGWALNDRVVIGPPGNCGECYNCRHGAPSLCAVAFTKTLGISVGSDGGMAEYVKVKNPRNMLFKLPDNVSFQDAVLIDTISVALHGMRLSNFRIGDRALVSGAGSIGLSAIQFLKIGGARKIIALEISKSKREMALKFGADIALDPVAEGTGLQAKIASLCGGIGADIAFECAGNNQSFRTLTTQGLVRGNGQIIALGVTQKESAIPEGKFVIRQLGVKGSLVYDEDDIVICLDLMSSGKFKTVGMVSDIIKLDDIVEKGFERLISNDTLVKVLIEP